MKRFVTLVAAVAIPFGAFALGRAVAEDQASDMAAWEALAKPGPKHAELAKSIGTWTIDSKMWMAPGAEPVASKGKATFSSVLDGRFLRQDFEGDMEGAPFRGIGHIGFNNATNKYEMTWIDNWGTGFLFMTGVEKEGGKVVELTGTYNGPNGVVMKSRSVMTIKGPDEQFLEIFNDMGQGETKSMEMTYHRAK